MLQYSRISSDLDQAGRSKPLSCVAAYSIGIYTGRLKQTSTDVLLDSPFEGLCWGHILDNDNMINNLMSLLRAQSGRCAAIRTVKDISAQTAVSISRPLCCKGSGQQAHAQRNLLARCSNDHLLLPSSCRQGLRDWRLPHHSPQGELCQLHWRRHWHQHLQEGRHDPLPNGAGWQGRLHCVRGR